MNSHDPDQPVFRFAPSPNGHLHLGHALSALYTWNRAQEAGGRFLLRLEDIDLARCSERYVCDMLEDLEWLGLRWEEPVRCQSLHFDDYRTVLDTLDELGVLYPCFATHQEIRSAVAQRTDHPTDPDGAPIYPGLARSLSTVQRDTLLAQGKPFARRIDMSKAVELARTMNAAPVTFEELASGPEGETGTIPVQAHCWGDVILARKDIPASYHIAVVHDDALQGVTHVTRGQDLFYATYVHRVLQILLGLPAPAYEHHGLIRDESGRRLSKSARDKSLRSLRTEGHTRNDIVRLAGLTSMLGHGS